MIFGVIVKSKNIFLIIFFFSMKNELNLFSKENISHNLNNNFRENNANLSLIKSINNNEKISSGRKKISTEINNLGTPAFIIEKFEISESSTVKKNKNTSNSKVAENRYANIDENNNEKINLNNVISEFGVYEKFNKKYSTYEDKDKTLNDMTINQKLNFGTLEVNSPIGNFYFFFKFYIYFQ